MEEALYEIMPMRQFARLISSMPTPEDTWIQAHWQLLKDINGKITSILCLETDVTRRTEKARENEDVIAAPRRSTAMIEFDLGGHVLDANQQFINAMGYNCSSQLTSFKKTLKSRLVAGFSGTVLVCFWQTATAFNG